MSTYRFVAGIDYGARKGTLGIVCHMTEGSSAGAVSWLAKRDSETAAAWRTRVRGVSANFVILADGEIVQMVAWGHASGSLNPSDRSTDKTFYGARFLKAALGTHYTDPNAYSISVEIAGYRNIGPTQAQVDALVSLVADARKRYPTLRGAYGHADQTDTKGCPGTTTLMRQAWTRIGHGLFAALPDTSTEDDDMNLRIPEKPMTVTVRADAWLYDNAACKDSPGMVKLDPNRPLPYVARIDVDGVAADDQTVIVAYEGTTADANLTSAGMYVRAADVVSKDVVPAPKPPVPDCTTAIKAAITADRAKARVVWS